MCSFKPSLQSSFGFLHISLTAVSKHSKCFSSNIASAVVGTVSKLEFDVAFWRFINNWASERISRMMQFLPSVFFGPREQAF